MNQPVAPLTELNILNIFNYSMEALSNNGGDGQRYIRFDRRRDKETFIRYMLECYQEYINFTTTVDVQEKQNYKNKYDYYSDDELSDLFETNTNTERQMELCLFYDATEYTSNGGRFQLDEIDSKNHWLIRIGDAGIGSNFRNSSLFNTWGMKRASAVKGFEYLVKKGDILWFIPGGTDGYVLAFAEYVNHAEIDYATRHQRYAELGWNQHGNNREWNVEIHYRNLRYTHTTESVGDTLEDRNRYSTQIKGNSVNVRIYNSEKCRIDLPQLYSEIIAENT